MKWGNPTPFSNYVHETIGYMHLYVQDMMAENGQICLILDIRGKIKYYLNVLLLEMLGTAIFILLVYLSPKNTQPENQFWFARKVPLF